MEMRKALRGSIITFLAICVTIALLAIVYMLCSGDVGQKSTLTHAKEETQLGQR